MSGAAGGASRGGGGRWIVAASIGAVEALKDQLGVCRWYYPLRLLQQHAKTTLQSATFSHTHPHNNIINSSSSAAAAAAAAAAGGNNKIERREMGFKKVMDLSCWGPTTVRF